MNRFETNLFTITSNVINTATSRHPRIDEMIRMKKNQAVKRHEKLSVSLNLFRSLLQQLYITFCKALLVFED